MEAATHLRARATKTPTLRDLVALSLTLDRQREPDSSLVERRDTLIRELHAENAAFTTLQLALAANVPATHVERVLGRP